MYVDTHDRKMYDKTTLFLSFWFPTELIMLNNVGLVL